MVINHGFYSHDPDHCTDATCRRHTSKHSHRIEYQSFKRKCTVAGRFHSGSPVSMPAPKMQRQTVRPEERLKVSDHKALSEMVAPTTSTPHQQQVDIADEPPRGFCRKHYRHHTKPVPCDVLDCPRGRPGQGFASRKDMEKHCWVEHRLHAETKGFRSTEGYCDLCGQLLRRKDNIIKHQKRSCRSRLK